MQAIILAAGMGKRIRSLSQHCPKVLLEVGGVCLLQNTLEQLYRKGVRETILVVGYKKEMILEKCTTHYRDMTIVYAENPDYETTNNNYSLYLGGLRVTEDVLIVEGDLLCTDRVLDTVCASTSECGILVSPYNPETMNGTVIFADGNDKAVSLVTKQMQSPDTDFAHALKTVNVYSMKKDFFRNHFMPELTSYIEHEDRSSYYEKALGALIYYGNHDIRVLRIDEKEWFEIDDENDLSYASEHFRP